MALGITTGRSVTTTEMDWRVDFWCIKPLTDSGPFNCTSWIWPTLVINVEPLSNWPGSMCIKPRLLELGFRSILFLWSTFKNNVTHCERLCRYEISRRSVSLTFGWWESYCLARHTEHTLRRKRFLYVRLLRIQRYALSEFMSLTFWDYGYR